MSWCSAPHPALRHHILSVRKWARYASIGLVAGLALQGAPDEARATAVRFYVSPFESRVTLGGGLLVDFGGAGSPVFVPFAAQVSGGGAGGTPLSGGPASDGLTTSVSGQLNPELNLAASPSSIQLRTRFELTPGTSGSWLPGSPADPAAPAPAQIGLSFADAGLGLSGRAALRDAAFVLESGVLLMQQAPAGHYRFPVPLAPGLPVPSVTWRLAAGVFDYETNLPGLSGRAFLPELSVQASLDDATLDVLAGGLQRLVIPVDLTIAIAPDLLGIAVPVTLLLDLSGEVVAYDQAVVPEPASAGLLAAGLVALAARARSGRRG